MTLRRILLAGLVSTVAVSPVAAEDGITVSTSEHSSDGLVTRSVHFAGACGEECLLASLSCGGPLEAELMDIPSAQAAKSVGAEQSLMILKAGGKSHEITVYRFTFSEMNGSWDATASGTDSAAVYKSLGMAKSFSLSVAGRSEKLPVTKEVQAWAEACLK